MDEDVRMGHEGVVGYDTVLTLHVSPLVVEAELKVSETVARCRPGITSVAMQAWLSNVMFS